MKATKILIPMLFVFGLASPLCAGTILYEDFEGASVGDPLVGSITGWTGDAYPVISDTLLDAGQSLDLCAGGAPAGAWPVVSKGFSYVPGENEYYVFSGTMLVPGTGGEYADPRLVSSSDNSFLQACLGYGKLAFVMWEGGATSMDNLRMEINVTPQPLASVDFKVVLESNRTDCYWRSSGDAEWTHAGGADFGLDLASYNTVMLIGHNQGSAYNGGFDSISLESVPEPGMTTLLGLGMMSLLLVARKRLFEQ